MQVAAVATARKLTVLVWHMLTKGKDYVWQRPALMSWKIRELELKAGQPSRRGGNKKGPAADYSLKSVRDKECQCLRANQEEKRPLLRAAKEKPPARDTGAAIEGPRALRPPTGL